MDEARVLDHYSYEDYLDIDRSTQERVELIDGHIYMMAGASAEHQDAVGNIFFILKGISKEKQTCTPRIAPYDLKLHTNGQIHVVQPDVMLFCDDETLPCAIFEVLSPSTAYKDKTAKRSLYEHSGVLEYYLADPILKIVEKFTLVEGEYRYSGAFGDEDVIDLACMEGALSIADIFDF